VGDSAEKVHDFQKSLKKGKKAESEFLELFKDKVSQSSGYIEDFVILRTGETIELKTDFHDPSQTPNHFIERYSYGEVNGGVWQAAEKKSTYYIFFYPVTMEFFVYKTSTLLQYLKCNFQKPWLLNIRNKGHNTRGFLVKRAALESIQLNLEDIL